MLNGQSQDFVNPDAKQGIDIIPKLSLFGHNARIWISDAIIIATGEDCTYCVWGMDGSLIKMFKEHMSRLIYTNGRILEVVLCGTQLGLTKFFKRSMHDPS